MVWENPLWGFSAHSRWSGLGAGYWAMPVVCLGVAAEEGAGLPAVQLQGSWWHWSAVYMTGFRPELFFWASVWHSWKRLTWLKGVILGTLWDNYCSQRICDYFFTRSAGMRSHLWGGAITHAFLPFIFVSGCLWAFKLCWSWFFFPLITKRMRDWSDAFTYFEACPALALGAFKPLLFPLA